MTLKIKKRKVPDNPVDINNIISLFFRINVLYFQQMTEPGKKRGGDVLSVSLVNNWYLTKVHGSQTNHG